MMLIMVVSLIEIWRDNRWIKRQTDVLMVEINDHLAMAA